ncbi:MAG: alpha/beta hydrolase-fold protein [Candidatus Latescibacterota bacterium]
MVAGLLALLWQSLCLGQAGTLERTQITSARLDNMVGDATTRPLIVYLPPGYAAGTAEYPTVYVLHGFFGNAESMTTIIPAIDSAVQGGQIPEMIYVFPDGSNRFNGSMYLGSQTIGDYESYLAADVVDLVDSSYRTIADRRSRGITGFSMGGWGSMRFALQYPETFGAVVAQAGAYDLDSDWWKRLSSTAASANPADWSAYGSVFAFSQFVFAMSAAANPNPDRPPFYLDLTYEVVDGTAQVVPERWEEQIGVDPVNGLLDGYLGQPVRLEGIKFVHGRSDAVVPVSQARRLDAVLSERGVEHVYVEHAGAHEFLPAESLQFLAGTLSGETRSSSVEVSTWAAIKAAF